MHEGRGLLDEGWVYSAGCGGSCSTHIPRPVPPEARGVVGRDMAGRSPGVVGVPPGESWSRIRVSLGPFTPVSTRTTSQASPAGTASTRRDSSAGGGCRLNRGLRFPSGTYFADRRLRSYPSHLAESAVLAGEVRPRSGPARRRCGGSPRTCLDGEGRGQTDPHLTSQGGPRVREPTWGSRWRAAVSRQHARTCPDGEERPEDCAALSVCPVACPIGSRAPGLTGA